MLSAGSWRELEPLDITNSPEANSIMRSFKHPWNKHSSRSSMSSTGFYEAAGNLGWIHADAAETGDNVIPMERTAVTSFPPFGFTEN